MGGRQLIPRCRLPLDRLVWEFKSRISALQPVADQEWVEGLRSAWWQLESVNAFWIKSGRGELSEIDSELDIVELRESEVKRLNYARCHLDD